MARKNRFFARLAGSINAAGRIEEKGLSTTVAASISGGGLDSAAILGLIDSDYIQIRQGGGADSATVLGLIDSAYIQIRQGGGADSATVLGLIDSDYIQARQTASSGGVDSAAIVSSIIAYSRILGGTN